MASEAVWMEADALRKRIKLSLLAAGCEHTSGWKSNPVLTFFDFRN